MSNDFHHLLEKYAELAVKVWLNVQTGQRLLLHAPIETAPLARLAAKCAYQSGSPFVEVFWTDGETTRMRYQYAPRTSYDEYSAAFLGGLRVALDRGDALLSISAEDPDLLKGLDEDFIAETAKRTATRFNDLNARIQRNEITWLALGMPSPKWAARVFPQAAPGEQTDKLWEAIFRVCRMFKPDPVAAWQAHIADLKARCGYMNERGYEALHYTGPGTDLTVYLPRGHQWIGAGETSTRGIFFVPNVPTEEIFTAPDRSRTQGVVTTTKPLVVRGVVIDRVTLAFEEGRVTRIEASNGQDVLERLAATDEGSARLGEVALVPNSNPISQLGITFYNTLFDENSASHLALGRAYPASIAGGGDMNADELIAHGINDSVTHLDFMIGSAEIQIDGIRADGEREAVMRDGEWAFRVVEQ